MFIFKLKICNSNPLPSQVCEPLQIQKYTKYHTLWEENKKDINTIF